MDEEKTLSYISKEISASLLEAIYLLEILNDIVEGEAKQDTLILKIKQNIKTSFENILVCQRMISSDI